MFRDHDIEEIERRKRHNERMQAAGEEVAKLVDRGAGEQREAVGEAVLEALARKYGLNDDDNPPAA